MGCAACARTCPIFFSHTLQLAYYFLLQLCFVVHVGVVRVVVLLASVPGTEPLKKKRGYRTLLLLPIGLVLAAGCGAKDDPPP